MTTVFGGLPNCFCRPLATIALVLTSAAPSGPSQAPAQETELRMIVVPTREQAEQILAQLRAGGSFEQLARQHSIDPSAASGGELGRVELATLRPEIRTAVEALAPGAVSEIIESSAGFMIVKLRGAGPPSIRPGGSTMTVTLPGDIRFFPDISGSVEVDYIFARLPKPPGWNQDLQTICEFKAQAVRTAFRQFESYVVDANKRKPEEREPEGLVNAHHTLAQLWAHQGQLEKTVEHLSAAQEVARSAAEPRVILDLEEKLGIAFLHLAAFENRVPTSHPESCLFPIKPSARYRAQDASRSAIRHFLTYLESNPEELEVRWLLNLAAMTVGEYPQGVPSEYRIPVQAYPSAEPFARYPNVAPLAGLDSYNMAGGAVIDDFDNDGLLDVITTSFDPCGAMHFFHNDGTGKFSDRTVQAGLSLQLGGLNLVQADYDNDGYMDVLVLRGAWTVPMRNSLLHNNGDGSFTDVTQSAGLALPATSTQTAAWADVDNDGHLDLFVGNEFSPAQLFRNDGRGRFTDIAPQAGVARTDFTKGVTAGDYDNDGAIDFYVSNMRGENFLYHNNKDGTFEEVAGRLRVQGPLVSFPTWFFDYDNDGWLDLYVSSYYPSAPEILRSRLRLPIQTETMVVYHNNGDGTFSERTQELGLDRVSMPMGANFGDLDDDGFLDIYLGTGSPPYSAVMPNELFKNQAGRSFVDVTAASGTGCIHKGHGVAFADIDNDGDMDLFAQMGGATPGDRHASLLFKNPGAGHSWITLKLVGARSNRCAIGAQIQIEGIEGDGSRRRIVRRVTSGGSFGASPLRQHIGLGQLKKIERMEIWWPASNTRQTFTQVPLNQFFEIGEQEPKLRKLPHPTFELKEKADPLS